MFNSSGLSAIGLDLVAAKYLALVAVIDSDQMGALVPNVLTATVSDGTITVDLTLLSTID